MSSEKAARRLPEKELLFCSLFASLRNAEEAARGAGFRLTPRLRGEQLLMKAEIRHEIDRIAEKNRLGAEAAAGFRRLAFGSVADAVSLLFTGENFDRRALRDMDFFNVSEIKQSKTGQLEIRFFDRQKALEMLAELSSGDAGDETRAFFEALGGAAKRRDTGDAREESET